MRLAIVSNCTALNRYVVETVMRHYSVEVVVRPVWREDYFNRKAPLSVKRITSHLKRKLQDHYLAWVAHRLDKAVYQRLFTSNHNIPPDLIREVSANNFNSFHTAEILTNVKPDLVLLFGAPIIAPGMLRTIDAAWINLHYGIAPAYRGEHTLFYPLLNEDYQNIGVTLHHVSKGVDRGAVLAYGYPQLRLGDSEVSLQLRSARMAAKIVLDFLKTVSESGYIPSGNEQIATKGTLVRYHDRQPWHELSFALKRKIGSCSVPERSEYIEEYFDTAPGKICSGF